MPTGDAEPIMAGDEINLTLKDIVNLRSNEQWLSALRQSGPAREAALNDLGRRIRNSLPHALSKYLDPSDPDFDALADDTVQETLIKVIDKLDTFQGRSQFTTWVYKIAVHQALSELRRKRWENISLDSLMERTDSDSGLGLASEPGLTPEEFSERADLLAQVQSIIAKELTEKQRQALLATQVHGMPASEVARRMHMKRNALYKLLHDARKRLKQALEAEGLSPEEILASFQ
ncbi:MAG: sigma-70 family RNA polymerase sigma factor [Anaerolineales bacterium]|jgi:RNA polymerase sigma-70 factor (ECF subfamily)